MKIMLVTDAWRPQVNGVVRTWEHVIESSEAMGHEYVVVHPGMFRTYRAPRYPEIRMAIRPYPGVKRMMAEHQPDAVHIATEGPVGQAGRRYCLRHGIAFTTSYHTQFPQYLRAYFKIPEAITYKFVKWFHGKAERVLVPTKRVGEELESIGMKNIAVWCRGVDTQTFQQYEKTLYADLPKPIFLYAGRVAVEKNIEAFLDLDLPGSKVVVGDGPVKEKLAKRYPGVHWAGYQFGEDLGRHYASADVFVFPSKTDTFGVVMLEANACGLPVAAYPVTGPIDVVKHGETGVLNYDLKQACLDALNLDSKDCRDYALANSWQTCAQFVLDASFPNPPAKMTPVEQDEPIKSTLSA